jgi:hypothetical protein
MDKSLPTISNSTTKREQIIKLLLSEGNHSTKNIARMVGTSEAYVYKEKSKLRTSGLLITRDTEVISRRSHEALSVTTSPLNRILGAETLPRGKHLNVQPSNTLLNVPRLDPEGLKKLYSEFRKGKKPTQIIAENGFHPELVESEYQRFSRFTENDIEVLHRKFFVEFNQELVTSSNNGTIRYSLVEKYNKEGRLTIEEFVTLIRLMLNEKFQVGRASVIYNMKKGIPPDGWQVVRCMNCNKPITGAIVDLTTEIGTRILNSFGSWTHLSCRV